MTCHIPIWSIVQAEGSQLVEGLVDQMVNLAMHKATETKGQGCEDGSNQETEGQKPPEIQEQPDEDSGSLDVIKSEEEMAPPQLDGENDDISAPQGLLFCTFLSRNLLWLFHTTLFCQYRGKSKICSYSHCIAK